MKICPNCGAQMDNNAMFCTSCGTPWTPPVGSVPSQGGYQDQGGYAYGAGYAMPYDHTAEFTAEDIRDNKVFCLIVYLLGIPGIIIAMLAANSSPYVGFHVRQALKITVASTLTALASVVLVWTVVIPIAGVVFIGVLSVIRIICFFRICSGKAIEAPIVRSISFLN